MEPCNFCPSVIGLFHLAQGSHLISGPVSKRIETGISRRYLHSHSYGSISRKSQGVETTSCPLTYEWIKIMWHAYRTELLFIPKRRGYLAIRDNLNTFILKVTADFRLGQDRGSLIQQPLLCRLQVKFKTGGQRNTHLQLYEVNTNRQMGPGSAKLNTSLGGLWSFFPGSCLLAYPKQVMSTGSLRIKTLGSTPSFQPEQ